MTASSERWLCAATHRALGYSAARIPVLLVLTAGAPAMAVAQTPPTPGPSAVHRDGSGTATPSASASGDGTVAGQVGPSLESELERTFWLADERFASGHYEQAAELFEHALDLSREPGLSGVWAEFSPKIAFNVAHSYRHAQRCDLALKAFRRYEEMVKPQPPEPVGWLQELLTECPQLTRVPQAAGVRESPPSPSPELQSTAPAQAGAPRSGSWLWDLNLPRPDSEAIQMQDETTPPVAGWTLVGLSAATAAGAVTFGFIALDLSEEQNDKTKYFSAQKDKDLTVAQVLSGSLGGVSAVLAGVGVYLLTQTDDEQAAGTGGTDTTRLQLFSDGTSLTVSGRF